MFSQNVIRESRRSTDHVDRSEDSYRLILLAGGWHSAADSDQRKVADAEEGRR